MTELSIIFIQSYSGDSDAVAKMWTNIRAKPGPGALHSHAACKLPSSMLLFGGERDGHPTNELWRFHFGM